MAQLDPRPGEYGHRPLYAADAAGRYPDRPARQEGTAECTGLSRTDTKLLLPRNDGDRHRTHQPAGREYPLSFHQTVRREGYPAEGGRAAIYRTVGGYPALAGLQYFRPA